jgi:NTE family protein
MKFFNFLVKKKKQINFVLTGGAAKGFIHLGMLKAFEELEIKPASITGTSAGALFGALYAIFGSYEKTKQYIDSFMESESYKRFSDKYFLPEILEKKDEKEDEKKIIKKDKIFNKDFFNKEFFKKNYFNDLFYKFSEKISSAIKGTKAIFNLFEDDRSFIKEEDIKSVYNEIYKDIKIEDLQIPFAAVATDLANKKSYIFKNGLCSIAIQASTSIPFIFPPVKLNNSILYDGGIISNLPVDESKETFNKGFCIGLDVTSKPQPLEDLNLDLIEILQLIISLSIYAKQESDRKKCDLLVAPVKENIPWFSFHLKDELIEYGYKSIISMKDYILKKI